MNAHIDTNVVTYDIRCMCPHCLLKQRDELLAALDDLVSVCDDGDGQAYTNAVAIIAKCKGA